MNKKQKEKFADLLLDIVKYIITAILLATWFSDLTSWGIMSYITLIVPLLLATCIGLSLYKEDKTSKNIKKNR